ncbi:ECF-type sigma factor [Ideonella sp. BN130291]|uniref:ECF-type sigma factor n=1 Tax=Ideonella sp. BN130291 TaxID=3112940 RepID=UPI002E25BF82|nr:ECF-type sigma factor [Ideonella sp. BN130291]
MDQAPAAPSPDAAPAFPADLYRQLRILARARLRHGGRQTLLDTTALVHEAYLRMSAAGLAASERRALLAYAGRTMRSVIVDFARKRQADRRGGSAGRVTLTEGQAPAAPTAAEQVLHVHEALVALEALDERLARVVELRYFVGLSEAEIAQALEVSERTVRRDWEKARLLLQRELLV